MVHFPARYGADDTRGYHWMVHFPVHVERPILCADDPEATLLKAGDAFPRSDSHDTESVIPGVSHFAAMP